MNINNREIYIQMYHITVEEAMRYAKSGQYETAINYLLPLALEGDVYAMNNLALMYQHTGRYRNAYEWYKKANMLISKENILALYYNKQIPFNYEEYKAYCNELIDQEEEAGYYYLSKLHMDNKFGVEDQEFAYLTVLKGLSKHFENSNSERLQFQYAYLLNNGIGCEVDYKKSNNLYRNLAKYLDFDILLSNVCRHNYAIQLRDGTGCEANIEEAIGFFSVAAFDGYNPSIKALIDIYTNHESHRDTLAALVWKTILSKRNLTSQIEEKYIELFFDYLDFKGMYIG